MEGFINNKKFMVYRKELETRSEQENTFFIFIKGISSLSEVDTNLEDFFKTSCPECKIEQMVFGKNSQISSIYIHNIPNLIINIDDHGFYIKINNNLIDIRNITLTKGKFGKLNLFSNSTSPFSTINSSSRKKSSNQSTRKNSLTKKKSSNQSTRKKSYSTNAITPRARHNGSVQNNIRENDSSKLPNENSETSQIPRNSRFTRFRKGAYQTYKNMYEGYKRRNPKKTNAYYELKIVYILNLLNEEFEKINTELESKYNINENLNNIVFYSDKLLSTIDKIKPKTLYKLDDIMNMWRALNDNITQLKIKLGKDLTSKYPTHIQMNRKVRWNNFDKNIVKFINKISKFSKKTTLNAVNSDIYTKKYNNYDPKLKLHNPTKTYGFHSRFDEIFDHEVQAGLRLGGEMLAFGLFS
jgi:hypothetical protein